MQLGLATNLLAQIPQATLSATKLYSKHPYLACFMFAAVLLVLLAFKVRGDGASDRFQVFDYRPWSWRRFWERRDVAKEDALDDIVCDRSTKHRVVRNVKRQVDADRRRGPCEADGRPLARDAEGLGRLGAERAMQAIGVLDVPVVSVPAAVAERLSGDGEDREERRVFAHLRYFRGPRRRVGARGGGGVPRHWFVCLSELRA